MATIDEFQDVSADITEATRIGAQDPNNPTNTEAATTNAVVNAGFKVAITETVKAPGFESTAPDGERFVSALNPQDKNNPATGDLWYNANKGVWRYYNGTGIIDIPKVSNIHGSFEAPITANLTLPETELVMEVYVGANMNIFLPEPSAQKEVIVYNTGAFDMQIVPKNAAIVRDGTLQADGVSMSLSQGAGNFVCMVNDGTNWVTLGYKGTLAEGTVNG